MAEKDKNKPNLIWSLVALMVFIMLLVASYKFRNILIPEGDVSVPIDPNCDLRKAMCTTKLTGGGSVSFDIEPKDIPLLRPLKLSVAIEGVELDKVEVAFVGVDMDMGFNQVTMKSTDQRHFEGRGLLSICTRTKMEWEARVLLYTKEGLVVVPFQFYTIKN